MNKNLYYNMILLDKILDIYLGFLKTLPYLVTPNLNHIGAAKTTEQS